MKLLSIAVLRREPFPATILSAEYDVSSFGYFQRSSIQEFLAFFSSTLTEKTVPGIRQAVQQDAYIGYVYTNQQGLTGVVIADHEYPQRVAFVLLNKVLDEFGAKYPKHIWTPSTLSAASSSNASTFSLPSRPASTLSATPSTTASAASSFTSWFSTSPAPSSSATAGPLPATPFPELKTYLVKYQDPHEADQILKVQRELDETKVILHKTIESLLDRGEKLDHLIDKSEKLSAQSKGFYKVAKKTNSCCWLQ